MALDHGVLNVPLAKRGNLDREISREVERQRQQREAQAKVARVLHAAARREALALIARMSDEHAARLAAKVGCPVRSIRKRLRSMAGANPELVLRALREGGAA